MVYRLVLIGIAIGPAIAFVLMPFPVMGLSAGVALGSLGVAAAVVSAFRGGERPRRGGPGLLRGTTLRHPPEDLPTLADQRTALAATLLRVIDIRAEPDAPPSRATAIARVLSRLLDNWQVSDVAALPRDLTMTLTLLHRVLTADPGEAGRIAQFFRRPDTVLSLRDEIDRVAETRATYDRNLAAYQATQALHAAGSPPPSLACALTRLSVDDPDLWHRIVTEHDPADPAQRAAALWCVAQPQCDRATVAAFLSRLPETAQLQNAAIERDQRFLDLVRLIIRNCNAGAYTRQELSYSPPADAASGMRSELDALSRLTRAPRWPDPQCTFIPLSGLAPRPRPAWDLERGGLIAPPNRADYL